MKCIVLEYADGSIATRGGLGPAALASFLILLRTGTRARLNVKQSKALLAQATAQEIEAARDAALAYILNELVPKQNPDAVKAEIVDVEFPASRAFRKTWRRRGGRIEVDMPAAREIKMARIREDRNRRLTELDALSNRARDMDNQPELARVLATKQRLRDIPQTIDLSKITDPEELARYEPEWP